MNEAEEIEDKSFKIIEARLGGIPLPEREVVRRVIHTTADFDFSNLLVFKNDPVQHGVSALRSGRTVVTDVKMVKAGISSKTAKKLGSEIKCFVDADDVYAFSRKSGKTRARSAFRLFKSELHGSIVVIGNAPTALFELCEIIKSGIKPSLVIATPVGFVGAAEAKEKILRLGVPSIVVRGNKGGSTVAVSVVNALLNLAIAQARAQVFRTSYAGEEKGLRRGYTTGTCAAAAAKASAEILFSGNVPEYAEVELPSGGTARLKIQDAESGKDFAKCCVVKDAGDDPDVTHGAKICAITGVRNDREIVIKGGNGVGRVTKKGLQIKVGEPAINPVPRRMIREEVRKVLPNGNSEAGAQRSWCESPALLLRKDSRSCYRKGAEITVFVPEGKKLAKRTMNEKLGIVDGISIIGTTGIVEPKSEDAFRRSLVPQVDIALANGHKEIVLTPGNIGEGSAVKRGIPKEAVVQTGNFVGYMLEECRKRGVKKALLFGSAGKLCKVAAGIFNTHSRVADGRMETIAAHASLLGADARTVRRILKANTTEAACRVLGRGSSAVFNSIAEKASARANEYVRGEIEFGTVILSLDGKIVGRDRKSGRSKWAKYLL